MTISRFFGPRVPLKPTNCNSNPTPTPISISLSTPTPTSTSTSAVRFGEWETPVGLTKDAAICIDDHDTDTEEESKRSDLNKVLPTVSPQIHTTKAHTTKSVTQIKENEESLSLIIGVSVQKHSMDITDGGNSIICDTNESSKRRKANNLIDKETNDSSSLDSKEINACCEVEQKMILHQEATMTRHCPNEEKEDKANANANSKNAKANTKAAPIANTRTNNKKESSSCCEEPQMEMQKDTQNPFLNFAYNLGHEEASYFPSSLFALGPIALDHQEEGEPSTTRTHTRSNKQSATKSKKNQLEANNNSNKQRRGTNKQKRQRNDNTTTITNSSNTKKKKKETNEIPFVQRSQIDQNACISKWHSFSDEHAPIQVRRFQVMIAARLHCQAHESSVRSAMLALRTLYSNAHDNDGGNGNVSGTRHDSNTHTYLCPETLAEADPQDIAKIISSILFANVKSKQIVQAAKEIKSQFRGHVPETKHGMKLVTGIGPKLAGLLYHVNSPLSYTISTTSSSTSSKE